MTTYVSQVVSLCSRRFLELAQMGRGGQAGRGPGWFVGRYWLLKKKGFGFVNVLGVLSRWFWLFLGVS